MSNFKTSTIDPSVHDEAADLARFGALQRADQRRSEVAPFDGTPVQFRVTVNTVSWNEGRGYMRDGEWITMSPAEAEAVTEALLDEAFEFNVSPSIQDADAITMLDVSDALNVELSQRLLTLSPASEQCDWRMTASQYFQHCVEYRQTFMNGGFWVPVHI